MLKNNKDRGSIKWTAMMLPEHIVKLRDWMDEDEYIDRPQLNDFDLQLIQEEIDIAYKSKCETLIKTWKSGIVTEHQGIIEDIDLRLMIIILESTNATTKIPVKEVISVGSMDSVHGIKVYTEKLVEYIRIYNRLNCLLSFHVQVLQVQYNKAAIHFSNKSRMNRCFMSYILIFSKFL